MKTTSKMKVASKMKTTSKMKLTSTMKMTITMKTMPKRAKCNSGGCIVYYLKKMLTTPHLDSYSTTDLKPEILSAVKTVNSISRDKRNVWGIDVIMS